MFALKLRTFIRRMMVQIYMIILNAENITLKSKGFSKSTMCNRTYFRINTLLLQANSFQTICRIIENY